MDTYLISSSSYYEINELVTGLIKDSTNIVRFDLDEVSLKDVIEETSYLSFFDDKKYIIVNNSSIFNEDDDKNYQMLSDYLNSPNPNVVLIFTYQGVISETKKLFKLIKEKGKLIIKNALLEKEIVDKLSKIFREHHIEISYMSINYIVNACQNNYDIVCSEINKIFIYLEDKNKITDDEVKEIITYSPVISNFKFSDAIINKDIVNSFKTLNTLMENDVDAIQLIGLLASQYRNMYITKIMNRKGSSKEAIAKVLNVKPYAVKMANQNSYNYSDNDLMNKITYLGDLDFEIKKGLIDGYRALELFILKLED